MKYTFNDWVNGNLPEDGPTDEEIANLPLPVKLIQYRPAWGRGSKAAEKAVTTRNRNGYLKCKEIFRREVLPLIRERMDRESLFDTATDLQDCDLIRESGYRFYALGESGLEGYGSWLTPDDPRIPAALEMGATPREPEEYFAKWWGGRDT